MLHYLHCLHQYMHFQKGGSSAEKVNAFFQKVVHFLKKGVCVQVQAVQAVQVVHHFFRFKNNEKMNCPCGLP